MTIETELQQFENFYWKWIEARDAAEHAQNELDMTFRKSLINNSKAPDLAMQEKVDDLWYCESERRINLDEFISERFS